MSEANLQTRDVIERATKDDPGSRDHGLVRLLSPPDRQYPDQAWSFSVGFPLPTSGQIYRDIQASMGVSPPSGPFIAYRATMLPVTIETKRAGSEPALGETCADLARTEKAFARLGKIHLVQRISLPPAIVFTFD